MQASRKPLAKVEGRRSLRHSGLTIAWRGTPDLDDWVAYIVNKTKSKKLILADQVSERKGKALLAPAAGLAARGGGEPGKGERRALRAAAWRSGPRASRRKCPPGGLWPPAIPGPVYPQMWIGPCIPAGLA